MPPGFFFRWFEGRNFRTTSAAVKRWPTIYVGLTRTPENLCEPKTAKPVQTQMEQALEAAMKMRRFGQTIKMPSTLAIKHQIVRARYEEEMRMKDSQISEVAKNTIDPIENVASRERPHG